jgi:membrane-associated protein
MELLSQAIDVFLHLDQHLGQFVGQYGAWTYAVLFVIVFCETGLVVTPILPGDSLLFAAGAIAASLGVLNPLLLVLLLTIAAVLGDAVNYQIGRRIGPAVFRSEKNRYFKREHLDKTHAFYERYGGKTIIIARFVPIVRTFAPFVAGVGQMNYARFAVFNITGAIAWVTIGVYAGYLFGNLEMVKKNFSLILIAIVFVSLLPAAVEFIRARRTRSLAAAGADPSLSE